MRSVWRTVPPTLVFTNTAITHAGHAAVARVEARPAKPGESNAPYILTAYGLGDGLRPWTRGVAYAGIGADLKMHFRLYPGTERDEILRGFPRSDVARRPVERPA